MNVSPSIMTLYWWNVDTAAKFWGLKNVLSSNTCELQLNHKVN